MDITPEDKTFSIPNARWDDFLANFKKLNRRAAKLGVPPATLEILEETVEPRTKWVIGWHGGERVEISKEIDVKCRVIRVKGDAPKLEGWSFAATIDRTKDTVIMNVVPGFEFPIPAEFRDASKATSCDHCKKDRRRNNTFIVRHDDGRWMRVGRTCVADFLGGMTPEGLAAKMRWLKVVSVCGDEYESYYRDGVIDPEYDTLEIMELSAAVIRRDGWVPRSMRDEKFPTADAVGYILNPPPRTDKYYGDWVAFRDARPVEDLDRKMAADALAWVRGMSNPSNDYLANLVALLAEDTFERKFIGYVASAIAGHMRHLDRIEEIRRREEVAAESEFIGEPGERIEVDIEITGVRYKDGYYDVTTITKMVTSDGNALTWFASGARKYEVGDKFRLRGTVKKHNEFRGVKETILTRCKRIDPAPAPLLEGSE